MAVDLRCASRFQRQSMVFMDDALIVLEHETASDVLRRFRYDRLASVMLWRRVPWVAMLVTMVALGVPGVLLLAFADTMGARVMGAGIGVVGVLLLLRYGVFQRTYIQLQRDGRTYLYTAVVSPGRMRRFRERLLEHLGHRLLPGTTPMAK